MTVMQGSPVERTAKLQDMATGWRSGQRALTELSRVFCSRSSRLRGRRSGSLESLIQMTREFRLDDGQATDPVGAVPMPESMRRNHARSVHR
jgi:hypothetical protein